MIRNSLLVVVAATTLAGCKASDPSLLLGTLERERVTVTAQAAERITRIDVAEGDEVHSGDPILSLDARRSEAHIDQARAEVARAESMLAELRNGTRIELIDAARANLNGAQASAANARRERDRLAEIRKRGLIAQATLDSAETALRNANAQRDAAQASLAQLLNGSRIEDVEQAEGSLASARAVVDQAESMRCHSTLAISRPPVRWWSACYRDLSMHASTCLRANASRLPRAAPARSRSPDSTIPLPHMYAAFALIRPSRRISR
jgi:HlyD family secretion protein